MRYSRMTDLTDKNFFITTAISYPNGPPHIGHAYELMATDAIARFARLDGRNVYFSTGTDDHGQKMFQTARDRNMTARDLADEMTAAFQDMTGLLNASQDDFIRTSEPRHYSAVQDIWRQALPPMAIFSAILMPDGIRCAMKPLC